MSCRNSRSRRALVWSLLSLGSLVVPASGQTTDGVLSPETSPGSAAGSAEATGLPPITQRRMLSGTGFRDTVDWEFRISEGRRAGEKAYLPVPSQWEQHGFGSYNYGHDEKKSREVGFYRHTFRVPEAWLRRHVEIVFEGVMTDTTVTINGRPAGPTHHGGFYRFRYPVTEWLRAGENVLEVKVAKVSANRSVEKAERDADYWVFGGIYRPVYLEVFPIENIGWIGADARHDGEISARVELRGLETGAELSVWVESLDGRLAGGVETVPVGPETATTTVSGRLEGVRPWSAEDPHLYRVVAELSRGGEALHRVDDRIGFRTFEVRPGEGLFVNGRRTLLKGVNRHAFWPRSGRTLDRELDRKDAERIKGMNMNTVRASHYPPDVSFLDLCDELGLYVLDELGGWHDAYDDEVGRQLVEEMIRRDVNHPSVITWNNGNEGGWNRDLLPLYGELDPQERPVLHPDEPLSGIDTKHYLTWDELQERVRPGEWRLRWLRLIGADDQALVMPTEVLHGLYDGGSAASLGLYWDAIRSSPRGAGAILWVFSDESIVRTDRNDSLDSDGNHAPDGILGPWRETSANELAVREIFSPIRVDPGSGLRDDGAVWVENRYDTRFLSDCRFESRLLRFPRPGEEWVGEEGEGLETQGPDLGPGEAGWMPLALPEDWRLWDAVRLVARERTGREVMTWVLPVTDPWRPGRWSAEGGGSTSAREEGDSILLWGGGTEARIDRRTGELSGLVLGGEAVALGPGPRRADASLPGPRVRSIGHRAEGATQVVEVLYEEGLQHARWVLHPSGWLRLSFQYRLESSAPYHGVAFDLPEDAVKSLTWLGDGPARVWRNRREGGTLGLWHREKNEATNLHSGAELELRGFFQGLVWARLRTAEGAFGLAFEDPDTFLGVLPPRFPEDSEEALAEVPGAGLTLLRGLPPIGTKFYPPEELGPQGQPHPEGLYRGSIWLFPWEASSPEAGE